MFVRVFKRKGVKVNFDKTKAIVVSEENPRCEVVLNGEQLERKSRVQVLRLYVRQKVIRIIR